MFSLKIRAFANAHASGLPWKYYLEYGKIRNSDKTKTDLGYVDNFLTGLFVPQVAEAPADAKAATTPTTTSALVSVSAAAVTAK